MEVLLSISVVIVAICAFLLILMVVLQSNRGSDLGLLGGNVEMVFGSQQMNALSKITITLAFIMIAGVFFIGLVKSYIQKNKYLMSNDKVIEGKVIGNVNNSALNSKNHKLNNSESNQK